MRKYVKLIFEHGSVIFRDIIGYYFVRETQTCTILFSKHKIALDMIYMESTLGRMIKYKDNLEPYKAEVVEFDEI